ncbi:MAG: hypothetical protein HXX09_03710 [Bacteroidetes bacterium]|nr:hypothetical protein [Bacteroidota bacterium]
MNKFIKYIIIFVFVLIPLLIFIIKKSSTDNFADNKVIVETESKNISNYFIEFVDNANTLKTQKTQEVVKKELYTKSFIAETVDSFKIVDNPRDIALKSKDVHSFWGINQEEVFKNSDYKVVLTFNVNPKDQPQMVNLNIQKFTNNRWLNFKNVGDFDIILGDSLKDKAKSEKADEIYAKKVSDLVLRSTFK